LLDTSRSIYLSFLNRELAFIRRRNFSEDEYTRFIKTCSMMNEAELYASFAQAHELGNNSKTFSHLVGELSRIGQLKLINAEPDFHIFLEKRRDLYSIDRQKYQNYFVKSQPLEGVYERSQKLHTTDHIKGQLINALNPYSGSNLISSDEKAILKNNESFLRDQLPDPKVAATFSVYEKILLAQSDKDARAMGEISTRLFCNHYTTQHSLISPTGIYNDRLIEDFDYFPHFDVNVNFSFLSKLGLDTLVIHKHYERDYFRFIIDKKYYSFCEMKRLFFSTMVNFLKRRGQDIEHCEPYKKFIRAFNFILPVSAHSFEPERYAEIITTSLSKATESSEEIAAALGKDGLKRMERSRIVIFTATDTEDEVVYSELLSAGYRPGGTDFFEDVAFSIYTYYDTIHIYHVRTSAGSGGVHGSTISSLKFLAMPNLDYAISVGICFGIDATKQKFGDVIVSESVLPYELAAARGGTLQPRGIPIPSDNMGVTYARSARTQFRDDFGIHVGPVLSGEKLVDDPDFKKKLTSLFPKAIGGEMECAGLAATSLDRNIPFIMFKGICDFAEAKDDKYQELAAKNASRLAIGMIGARWSKK